MKIANILSNAFNKNYTADQDVTDLGLLINEAALIELRHGSNSPRFIELQRLIHVQKRLAKAKLDSDTIFDQLGNVNVATIPRDN